MNSAGRNRFSNHLRIWLSRWRVWRAVNSGVTIGPGVQIGAGCDILLGGEPARRGRIALGAGCRLENDVVIRPYNGSVDIGRNVHLGPGTVIYGHGNVSLGDGCLIAPHCTLLSSNHDIPSIDQEIRDQPSIPLPCWVGRDVWLGAGVQVLGGVRIGDGCVVGAGSVVTGDLLAGAIAWGTPARIKKLRPEASPESL